MTAVVCSISGCEKRTWARGWCKAHYCRWQKYGDPLGGGPAKTPDGAPMAYFHEQMARETNECIVWPYGLGRGGYGSIRVGDRKVPVHRYACELTYGPPGDPDMQAAHGPCHNPACFNPRHLSWKTRKGNAADRYRDGTTQIGEKNPAAKLSATAVREMRERYGAGKNSQQALAREYGVDRSTVRDIVRRKRWAHIP